MSTLTTEERERELALLIAQSEVDLARLRGERVTLCRVCIAAVADPLLYGHELRHLAEEGRDTL